MAGLTVSASSVSHPLQTQHATCRTCNSKGWILGHTHQHHDGTWGAHSASHEGRYYLVTQDAFGEWRCSCPARVARCRHVRLVEHLVAHGYKHDLPHGAYVALLQSYDFDLPALYDER